MDTEPDEAEALHKEITGVNFRKAVARAQLEGPGKVTKIKAATARAEALVAALQEVFNGGKSGSMTVTGETCAVESPVHTDPKTGRAGEGASHAWRALSEMLAAINSDISAPYINLQDGSGPNEATLTFTKEQLVAATGSFWRGMANVMWAAKLDDPTRTFASEAGTGRQAY